MAMVQKAQCELVCEGTKVSEESEEKRREELNVNNDVSEKLVL